MPDVSRERIQITWRVTKRRIQDGKIILSTQDGPDVIRTHDLPVISRAHHRAMLRAQKFA